MYFEDRQLDSASTESGPEQTQSVSVRTIGEERLFYQVSNILLKLYPLLLTVPHPSW